MIFRGATPNRPYFTRRLTAIAVAGALRVEAIEGTQAWASSVIILQEAGLDAGLYDSLVMNSLCRGLLFLRAAILAPAETGHPPFSFQLAEHFTQALRLDNEAAIAAFQGSVLRECGVDIAAVTPPFD